MPLMASLYPSLWAHFNYPSFTLSVWALLDLSLLQVMLQDRTLNLPPLHISDRCLLAPLPDSNGPSPLQGHSSWRASWNQEPLAEPAHSHCLGSETELPRVPEEPWWQGRAVDLCDHPPPPLLGCSLSCWCHTRGQDFATTKPVFLLLQMTHLQGNAMVSFTFLECVTYKWHCDTCLSHREGCPPTSAPFKPPSGFSWSFQESCDVGNCPGPIIIGSVKFPSWMFGTIDFTSYKWNLKAFLLLLI